MSPPPKNDDKDEVPVTIRFPRAIHAAAAKAADKDQRSFNLFVVRAVAAATEREARSTKRAAR